MFAAAEGRGQVFRMSHSRIALTTMVHPHGERPALQSCYGLDSPMLPPLCHAFDLDAGGSLDLGDFRDWQVLLQGPAILTCDP